MTSRVYLATCAELPGGDDEDGELLLSACRAAGLDAHWKVWTDPTIDWTAASATVVRATWDYSDRHAEFVRWAQAVPRLHNAMAVLRWNSDKSYLRELSTAGVAVVPTAWAAVGQAAVWPEDVEFVVKPAIGAGSRGAGRFAAGDIAAAQRHLDALHADGLTAMIQPYLAKVDDAGETGMVFIDGGYSHAIRKGPMLAPDTVNALDSIGPRALFMAERISARTPSRQELTVAESVLRAAGSILDLDEPPLYARVDLLPGADGPVLIELELTEPSLFLSYAPGAAAHLAQAIASRTEGR